MDAQAMEVDAFKKKIERTVHELKTGSVRADAVIDETNVKKTIKTVMSDFSAVAERFGNFQKGAMALLYPDKVRQRELSCPATKARLFTVFVKDPKPTDKLKKGAKKSGPLWAEVTFSVTIQASGAVEW